MLYYLIETADSSQRDKYRDSVRTAYTALGGAQGANTLLSRVVSVVFNFAGLNVSLVLKEGDKFS